MNPLQKIRFQNSSWDQKLKNLQKYELFTTLKTQFLGHIGF